LTYAPHAFLYSGEEWWPSDITTHLAHTTPEIDFKAVGASATVNNLSSVSTDAYLTSNDNVEDNPDWLVSTVNKPDSSGYSSAPATIICSDKGDIGVDCFYFYFYSYNHGPSVFGTPYGNHVGDWEHTMVRFVDGVPEYLYLSAHGAGFAFNYTIVPTTDGRPNVYIAVGSHANYGTAGDQELYDIPFDILHDTTDAGPFWDVTLNYRGYWFDNSTQTFTSAGGKDVGGTEQESETVDWLYWTGAWGDEQYPSSDSRQDCIGIPDILEECEYVSGPTGPLKKNLGRTAVCQTEDDCTILQSVNDNSVLTHL